MQNITPQDLFKRGTGKGLKPTTQVTLVLLLFVIVFVLAVIKTGVTFVEGTEVGVIINNITHKISVRQQPGYILHLPMGLTDVHIVNCAERVIHMTQQRNQGNRKGVDDLRIKTRDGSNVNADVTVNYTIDKNAAEKVTTYMGAEQNEHEQNIETVVRAYVRTAIRDELGKLLVEEISEPSYRDLAIKTAQASLDNALSDYGIRVTNLLVSEFDFNEQYEQLIKDRKEADQMYTNQAAAQETALSNQRRAISSAEREKNNAVVEERGKQRKRVIEAEGMAAQVINLASGEAYKTKLEGERTMKVDMAEAKAIEAEGLRKAEGITKMAEAYEKGGMGLIREALAEKYIGRTINGRPFSLSSHVDRLQLESSAAAAATSKKEVEK
jgi:regulator of protease activity HflC (stomatin/prohibitin superfamily)